MSLPTSCCNNVMFLCQVNDNVLFLTGHFFASYQKRSLHIHAEFFTNTFFNLDICSQIRHKHAHYAY